MIFPILNPFAQGRLYVIHVQSHRGRKGCFATEANIQRFNVEQEAVGWQFAF